MASASKRALLGGLLLAATIAAAGTAGAGPPKREVHVCILVSQDAPPFQAAVTGVKRALETPDMKPEIEVVSLHGEAAQAASAIQKARQERAQVVLTLGSLATQAAVKELREIPIVAGLILNADDLGKAPNATAVTLEFPAEIEFRWLQRLLPGEKNIAVLYNPAENQVRVDAAGRAAKGLGLVLNARRLESPKELPDALDALTNHADVLWGIADQVVLTPQTAQPILLFSMRNRIPFVGLSENWVKAGALYALDRDYQDIGAQCGELAVKVLQGTPPASLPPVSPRKVVYSINLRTARHMKLDIPSGVLRDAQTVIE